MPVQTARIITMSATAASIFMSMVSHLALDQQGVLGGDVGNGQNGELIPGFNSILFPLVSPVGLGVMGAEFVGFGKRYSGMA